MKNTDPKATEAVVVKDLTVRFNTGSEELIVVNQLDLRIPTGSVLCLLGPNGAGKTTTINVLMGLVRPASGTVRVFGRDPWESRREVLRRVALVPQETALYEKLTGHENLAFHGQYYGVSTFELEGRVQRALEIVGLVDRAHDRVNTYSGGMRRRLAMARTLVTDADFILLDEPTVGVDVQSRNSIWHQIHTMADEGRSVLLTTNYMDEAEALADDILLIDRGQAVARGSASTLKSQVGTESVQFQFAEERHARAADQRLNEESADLAIERVGTALRLPVKDPQEAIALLNRLPSLLGDAFAELERFEVRQPGLQDVFLHYTGRALRD